MRCRLIPTLVPCLLIFFAASYARADNPHLTIRDKTFYGHELRVFVETSVSREAPLSHSSTTSNVRSYLLIIDITAPGPLTQRTTVYGPLYDVPLARSEISFSAGVNFTDEDVAAAQATPHCAFDDAGDLVRYRFDLAKQKTLFDRLDLATCTWKQSVALASIEDKTMPGSEDKVITSSGKFMLLYQGDAAHLYDLATGLEIKDDWLTNRFAEARRIPKFENVVTLLTDDLNHLIVSPHAIWNEDFGNHIYKTFDYGGKTLARDKFFLCASRPAPAFTAVTRDTDQRDFLAEAPTNSYVIDNKLALLYTTESTARLYRIDGTDIAHTSQVVPGGYQTGSNKILHRAVDGLMIFFTVNITDMNQVLDRHLAMTTWDYRNNTVTHRVESLIDLFKVSGGQYEPSIAATPVK